MAVKGPITVVSVGSGEIPERKDYDVTLKFKLSTFAESLDCPSLTRMLQNVFKWWDEGRYPFDVEMVQAGLGRCINRALQMLLEEQMQEKYGHEMVPNGNRHTAKWCLEAEKAYHDLHKPWLNTEPTVEIVRCDP